MLMSIIYILFINLTFFIFLNTKWEYSQKIGSKLKNT
jgi:hypothetical protein